jgi:hypothetical protein
MIDQRGLCESHAADLVSLVELIREAVGGDRYWEDCLSQFTLCSQRTTGLHLGIFAEPYLQYLLDGTKTIESRFSARRTAPYGRVARGDVVLLKQVSGPIVGVVRITDAWYYRLDSRSWSSIRREYTAALRAEDPAFWEQRKSASFASLMRVAHVLPIRPVPFSKRDRRGWVVLGGRNKVQPELPL